MKKSHAILITSAALLLAGIPIAQGADDIRAKADKAIAESFLPGEGQDLDRLKRDETLNQCNQNRGALPADVAVAIVERERAAIKYPADGKLMGDWKEGEKYFKMGFAYRIGRIEPDDPKKDRGGNCYACHAGDPKEVAFGTIGTPLTGYGKARGTSEAIIKYTYEKIYNSQAFVACSQMPRMGHNGILSPEKIAHLTAYLLAPESPINK